MFKSIIYNQEQGNKTYFPILSIEPIRNDMGRLEFPWSISLNSFFQATDRSGFKFLLALNWRFREHGLFGALTGGRKNGIDLVERFFCLSFLAHHDSNSRIWKISGG